MEVVYFKEETDHIYQSKKYIYFFFHQKWGMCVLVLLTWYT